MSELAQLAKPFPAHFIHSNPSGGGDYVTHSLIVQKLLATLSEGFTFEMVEVLRGYVPGVKPNPDGKSQRAKNGTPDLENAVVGVVCRFTTTIDGHPYSVCEVGDCEQPHNWGTDGARLKDAMSDALKRCAMRLGVGLHLWSQRDGFFLYEVLVNKDLPPDGEGGGGTATAPQRASEGDDEASEGSVAPPRRSPPKPPEGWKKS